MDRTQTTRSARYRRTLRGAYSKHKENAKRRGVGFLLTFEEWSAVWKDSGRLRWRGHRPGCYVMCRTGDEGPYALGNVYIGPAMVNFTDGPRNARRRSKLS